MNTTAAATQAGVTVATIRNWCRYGAVAAVKQAGRWVIDAVSLTRRIAIGARKGARVVDLSATYTVGGRTHTPHVRRSDLPSGQTRIRVRNLVPFFADDLDRVADPDLRAHHAWTLAEASITIWSDPRPLPRGYPGVATRDDGRLVANCVGGFITDDRLLDLAEQLRDTLR
ncbi:hypothetical protein ACF1DY_26335 [Streptomyces albus]